MQTTRELLPKGAMIGGNKGLVIWRPETDTRGRSHTYRYR